MADYATTNTWRYKVKYFSNFLTHTLMVRTMDTDPVSSGVPDKLAQFFDDLGAFLPADFAILSADMAAPGVVIMSPTTPPAPILGSIAGSVTLKHSANYFTFGYKSGDGVIGDFQVFGIENDIETLGGTNWRLTAGESVSVDTAVATLQTANLTTISGQSATFRTFVNTGVSAYWQRKNR